MPDTGYDAATLAFYAREAPDYVASGHGGTSRHLDGFLQRLRPGARILELGCGSGRDAAEMLRRGFDVVATDGVAEMAAQAQARLGVPVKVLRFDELAADRDFDAVWAHASLLHVPRAGLVPVLAAIYRALKPGGLHFACYKAEGRQARDRFDRLNNHLSLDQACAAYAAAAPWRIVDTQSYNGGGYDGRQGPWIAIIAAREAHAR